MNTAEHTHDLQLKVVESTHTTKGAKCQYAIVYGDQQVRVGRKMRNRLPSEQAIKAAASKAIKLHAQGTEYARKQVEVKELLASLRPEKTAEEVAADEKRAEMWGYRPIAYARKAWGDTERTLVEIQSGYSLGFGSSPAAVATELAKEMRQQ